MNIAQNQSGVNIDKKLNFDSHVSYLCKKTSRQVNSLSRLRHIANENSKNMLYKTYIFSNFNYCFAIWNYCSTKSIIKLEKLNKRALRRMRMRSPSCHNVDSYSVTFTDAKLFSDIKETTVIYPRTK